jgi:hypothetical protein
MRFRSALAGLGGAVLTFGGLAVPARAVQSAPPRATVLPVPSWCARGQIWDVDGRTVGARCDVTFSYYVKVTCTNGSTRKVARSGYTNDNRWEYAYCTAFGSNWRVVPNTGGPVKAP